MPGTQKQAAQCMGALCLQTMTLAVLPGVAPGILTGTVIGLALAQVDLDIPENENDPPPKVEVQSISLLEC